MSERAPFETFETPITIGVIADTHFGARPAHLPPACEQALREADLILHAGDFCSVEGYDLIASLGHLRGVRGNNDSAALVRLLPDTRVFRVGQFTIAMIHGHGFGRLTAREAAERELVGRCDMAVFGHSHRPVLDRRDGTLLFNPGSPTDRRWEASCSYGIVRIDQSIEAELHYLNPLTS